MGGSALNVPTKRLSAADYHSLAAQLSVQISQALDGAQVVVIPAYREKSDFGDLDLIVEAEKIQAAGGKEFLVDWTARHTHARDVYCEKNSTVFSFDYRPSSEAVEGFQVDLLMTPRAEIEVATAYFSYNDLGNLVGRTAHKMGFTHGHRGLLYPVRDGNYLFDTLVISQKLDEILPFLGYDPAPFRAGFDTLEDIFRYTVSTPYFNRDSFLLENRNHTSRTRDRKRPTYRKFLEWIDVAPGLNAYAWADREDEAARSAEKTHFLAMARQRFPSFAAELDDAWASLAQARKAKERFNGKWVSELVGLDGKALGQFMESFRQHVIGEEGVPLWVARHTDDQMVSAIKAHRASFQPRRPLRGPH